MVYRKNRGFLAEETLLIYTETMINYTLFILSFFQMAGEKKFKYIYIPWGGLGVALTWGVLHFTSIENAVYAAVMSTIIGIVYILGKKAFIPTFLMTFLLFMI